MRKLIKNDINTGLSLTGWVLLTIGLCMQVASIICDRNATVLGSISTIAGAISIVLCMERKFSFYFFSLIQLVTCLFGVALPHHLYGKVIETVFCIVTAFIGIYLWTKDTRVKTMASRGRIVTGLSIVVSIIGMAILLVNLPSIIPVLQANPQPILNSITTVLPLFAQILLICGFQEQWYIWIIVDLMNLIMFALIGDWIMVVQYAFWTICSIYGFINWYREAKRNN